MKLSWGYLKLFPRICFRLKYRRKTIINYYILIFPFLRTGTTRDDLRLVGKTPFRKQSHSLVRKMMVFCQDPFLVLVSSRFKNIGPEIAIRITDKGSTITKEVAWSQHLNNKPTLLTLRRSIFFGYLKHPYLAQTKGSHKMQSKPAKSCL